MLKDLSVLTGGNAITEDLGLKLENVTLDRPRSPRSALQVDKDNTTIIDGAGKQADIDARVKHDPQPDRGGDLGLRQGEAPGAPREARRRGRGDQRRCRDRDGDEGEEGPRRGCALHATRAAVEEGVVPGGGVALLRAQHVLDTSVKVVDLEQAFGVQIVRRAIEEPLRQIAANAGVDGSIVISKVKEGKGGRSASTPRASSTVTA